MLNRKEISLRQKVGIVLGGAFLTLSLGSVPAIANEAGDESFSVEYLLDSDNSNTYKLIVVSDFERHNSVITTIDLFEEIIENSSREVTINGITFDKETLVVSSLESYDKNEIVSEDAEGLDFRYIYDEDYTGKHATKDLGKYDLIALSDYERNISIVTSISVFEKILEEQTDDVLVINGFQFNRQEVLSAVNRASDGLDESLINREDTNEERFRDVKYIDDDNHTGKYSYDEGEFRLVTVADYDSGNVVTMTPKMFEYVVNINYGDYVTINGIQFDRELLLNVKEQADAIKEEREKDKNISNGVTLVIVIVSSVVKAWIKAERKERKKSYGSW